MSNIAFKMALSQFVESEKMVRGTINGKSMLPFIKPGQKVFVSKCPHKLRIGDCYLFNYNNKLLLHRLLFKTHKKLLLMGDNSPYIQVVSPDNVIATLVKTETYSCGIKILVLNLLFFCVLKLPVNPSCTLAIKRKIFDCLLKGKMNYERTVC